MASTDPMKHLLERDAALHEIDGALAQARAGTGSLLVIEGAAGEGKTALLAAVRERSGGIRLTAVDDAHELHRDVLTDLAGRAQELANPPQLLLVAFRPDEPGADGQALDGLRTTLGARLVILAPLGPESVATLLRARRPDAGEALCRSVHEATGGNPLYLKELLAGDPTRSHIVSVGDRVLGRIGSIGPDAVSLAVALAVLGDGQRLELAARVAGLDGGRAQAIAHRLRRMGVLASEDPTVFAQPLVRRSIYHGLPDAERHTVHRQAARVLREAGRPDEEVAHHLAALIPEGSSEVASGLAGAAHRAGESDNAIRWLRRALNEAAPDPPRAELLQSLGHIELVARESTSILHLREALELTTEPATRAQMGVSLAEILAHTGQWEEMIAVMRSVERDVHADTGEVQVRFASVLAAATAHDAARVHMFDGQRARLELLSRGSSWSAHALAALLASISAQRGEPPGYALRTAERSLEDGLLLAEQGGGGWAAPHVLGAFILSDANDRALALCDEMEAASVRTGADVGSQLTPGYRAWIHTRLGDLIRAETEFRRALESIPDDSMQMIAVTFFFVASEVMLERPGLSHLHAKVEAVELEPAFNKTWSGGMHLWVRARIRLLHRDQAGGIADLRAVALIAGALRTGPSMAPWRSVLALALPREERDEAVALVEEELEIAHAGTLPRAYGVALRALGLLTPGPAGLDILRDAVEVLADSPARLEHARALVELGAALRRGRHRSDARRPLGDGLELATACGASRLAARARAELAAAAGRPPRHEPTDQLLTPSELRASRLAIAGSSNREIARELFVSVKTVETHLSHVYTKLGLSGRGARGELGAALAMHQPMAGRGLP